MRVDAVDVQLPLSRPRAPREDGKPPLWRLRVRELGVPVWIYTGERSGYSVHALSAWEAIGILATVTPLELAMDGARWRYEDGDSYKVMGTATLEVVEVAEDDEGAQKGAGT